MKRTFKKAMSILFVSIVTFGTVVSMCSFVFIANAEEVKQITSGYYTYVIDEFENAVIFDVDESISGEVKIPSTLDGYPVTSIAYDAFRKCDNITGVTIPEGVTYIADDAFAYLDNLTIIEIPDSVTEMGSNPFLGTGYYNDSTNWENDVLYIGKHLIDTRDTISGFYEIKEGTLTIADDAFHSCTNLESVAIPNSIVSIGYSAFYRCIGLKSITIPDSVSNIHNNAFYYTGYYNDASNWENGVLYIGNHLIEADHTKTGSYNIKEGTKTIADFAFYCSVLTNISIPGSVTNIGNSAFEKCSGLTDIIIPDSVTSIGVSAFEDCLQLENVIISDSVTKIGRRAFYSCNSLDYIHIPSSVKLLGNDVIVNTSVSDEVSVYICSDTSECYAKTYADVNGIEFRVCDGHGESNMEEEPSSIFETFVKSITNAFYAVIQWFKDLFKPILELFGNTIF